ncbi:MAG: type II toxin-antitoxin system Phd/YefM family antitoxin, partial [Acidobacteriota bacterium]
MKVMTAKQLKNRTGEALRQVMQGEEILVTVRGKPAAVMRPPSGEEEKLP